MSVHEYEVGLHKSELDTPALLLDLAVMERNLKKMSDCLDGSKAVVRPHVKLHKATPVLARMQIEAGGVGLTCSKLSEAETLADAGFKDILIANEIIGPRKIRRLVNLAAYTDVKVAVDNAENVQQLSEAAQAKHVQLGVVVEVNVGHNRSGVDPFEKVLELSRLILASPGLRFMGIMGYDGHCTSKVHTSEREDCSRKANCLLADTLFYLEAAGLEVPIVSASGTYTYRYASQIDGITEIQAGSYLFADTALRENGQVDFECALSILATVISRQRRPGAEDIAFIDVGRKMIDTYLGLPEVKDPPGAQVLSLSQEHGKISLVGVERDLEVGDRIEIWVRDANGTITLHDRFYALRDDRVEAVWDIPGRGRAT